MTMLSFHIDEDDAKAAEIWAARLGIDPSELARRALSAYLERLRAERGDSTSENWPRTDIDPALGDTADWGQTEDWSDWVDGVPPG
jgi:hypothetical protein